MIRLEARTLGIHPEHLPADPESRNLEHGEYHLAISAYFIASMTAGTTQTNALIDQLKIRV